MLSPTMDDTLYINETITLNWDHTLLEYFEVTEPFSGMGKTKIAQKVQLSAILNWKKHLTF